MPGKAAAIAVIAVLGIIVYFCLDPARTPFPRCPFKMLTGLSCPGCGTQRAIHQLLHLNFAEALKYNASLALLLPVLALLGLAELLGDKAPGLRRIAHSPVLSWSILALISAWFVLRNVFGI